VSSQEIRVPGWPMPRGYANGRTGQGAVLHVAGQIGWDEQGVMAEGLVAQFARALENVVTVVRAAGGAPEDIAEMTVFVTDIAAYRASAKQLGPPWRALLGKHFPAMTLVAVTALVEPQAMVEIQATAYIAAANPGGPAGAGGAP
jgi:enamine deaminase RidA (YjgF/YER057c/UK114 family)